MLISDKISGSTKEETRASIPKKETALSLLDTAYEKNPGLWKDHSIVAAQVAFRIAQEIPGADPEWCEMGGLLHDIGRICGKSGVRHTVDGFDYLSELGYSDLARYCITHAFPGKRLIAHTRWDFSAGQLEFVRSYLDRIEYDLTDKIIQIADFMATAYGPMVMEVRLMETALRNSINEKVFDFWQECFRVRAEIDRAVGGNVNDLFDHLLIDWPKR
ncbi:MAG TPA: HD domain-containing protein [Thermotogota bacterium]|nr:HD domain-containing protein [Thermotogota bacterium]MDD8041887.1 HD domain-containing protein [Thermotogota bacterium]MDD8053648.1 HD domain-containing protein [Thermotogota bacterium]HNR64361.1 HD domain-containing protein [Thermotogota bacterium]HNT96325.1 HD domain-containing protein [Thermotogota bacterium]